MKFYNLYNLNVKVGDIVYNNEGFSETIISISDMHIDTNDHPGCTYSRQGIYTINRSRQLNYLYYMYMIVGNITRIYEI
jgi:hypothetical protein